MNVVFVMAHQDDEIAFVSRIRAAVANGATVTCVCLTDGAARTPVATRDAESRRVLAQLGVEDYRVAVARRIPDGALATHLDAALTLLEALAADADEVITLAWEGGHQDHDAAHVVAAVFAHRRAIPCIEMPLYNGYRTRGPFFRVNTPAGDGWRERRLRRRDYFRNVLLARFYRSQRRTWLGLLPLYLLGAPRELTREVRLERLDAPPHPRPLLYERRFGYSYERLAQETAQFLLRQSLRR